MKKAPRRSRAKAYLEASRTWAASVVFVAPLFALYEVALTADEGVRSGTVPLVRELFHPVSHVGLVAMNLILLGLLCLAIYRTRAKRRRAEELCASSAASTLSATKRLSAGSNALSTTPIPPRPISSTTS